MPSFAVVAGNWLTGRSSVRMRGNSSPASRADSRRRPRTVSSAVGLEAARGTKDWMTLG